MSRHFDAVIVGGGVTGAIMAKLLSEHGKSVLILEAGIKGAMDPENYRKWNKQECRQHDRGFSYHYLSRKHRKNCSYQHQSQPDKDQEESPGTHADVTTG